jgi:hypothetical protein
MLMFVEAEEPGRTCEIGNFWGPLAEAATSLNFLGYDRNSKVHQGWVGSLGSKFFLVLMYQYHPTLTSSTFPPFVAEEHASAVVAFAPASAFSVISSPTSIFKKIYLVPS